MVVSILLALALMAAISEEMPSLPFRWFQRTSQLLAQKRTWRNVYIGVFVGIIFISTVINMVINLRHLLST